jgi:lipopolysaccharide/colanic/teichoic acid biosynthesis glycosyltransferase
MATDTAVECIEPQTERPPIPNDEVELPPYLRRKRAATRCIALLLLLIAGPIIVLLCVLIRLTSKGPAIFRQVRVGIHGVPFEILKLRTMYLDAERVSGPTWCSLEDTRITPLGKALRFLHLDELPQLINVVRGEMDLIGPRPERPEIIAAQGLETLVLNYTERHRVLPGVTGLAQINLPADQTIDCVHRKVALDLEYIYSASLGLDLAILTCTAMRMLGIRHGIAVRLLRLDRPEVRKTRRQFSPGNSNPVSSTRSPYSDSEERPKALLRSLLIGAGSRHDSDDDAVARLAQQHPR